MGKKLALSRNETPGTFYIEENPSENGKGLAKIVITRFDGSQHVDYPVQYADGSFGYDFPERVPPEVRAVLKRMFTVETEEADPNITDVIFRYDKHGKNKEVTAVFPGMAGGYRLNEFTCYSHIGQHGTGSMDWLSTKTRPATPAEYADLYKELTQIGYNLRIVKRCTKEHRRQREAQLRA